LIYVSDAAPGIRRIRDGDGFVYQLPDGRRLTDERELARIAALAIPPAYEDVWICTNARGHLQATGRDARGRKQYRYHPKWRVFRDGTKFDRMTAFGAALPRLRRRLRRDLALPELPREKVLAVIVSILDATRVRIGNAEYARDNDSYGLTTLRNRHVRFIRDGRLLFRFRGKGGAEHEVPIDDKRLARIVRHCHQLPGQRLFQYVDETGARRPIDSDQVNAYLKDAMGDDFTAKDFRTWGATLRAIAVMNATPLPERSSERALNACIVDAVKQVAADLRNTPAVCRKSYINPAVFTAWRTGELHEAIGENMSRAPRRAEQLALAFLRQQPSTLPDPTTERRLRTPSRRHPRSTRRESEAAAAIA
jgi:DNA topoisomerase IB